MAGSYTIHDMASDERPRERFMQVGEHGMRTAELLAIILRTAGVRGQSVISTAEQLLQRFDGLPGIARASLEELQQVDGIGPTKSIEIKAALALGRRLMVSSPQERPQITAPVDAANLLMSDMMLLEQEHLKVLLLDTRNRVLNVATIYVGSLNTSVVRIGELFKPAIKQNAASVIVAHNHPSGDPTPSPEDVRVTRELVKAGQLLSIEVLDHLVIGHNRWVSLKERGLGF